MINDKVVFSMDTTHRPWPIPKEPWVMKQTWYDLLFAHWEVDPNIIKPLIPNTLHVDTYNGRAWIAVVPFRMSGIHLRNLPEIPFTSKFPEINVRTYVTYQDKPGVYFFSLDATNYLAVQTAKYFFHLPYYFSKINVKKQSDTISYKCKRNGTKDEHRFNGIYRSTSDVFLSKKDSLEYWLTERYCLYTEYNNKLFRGDIHHDPWSLQLAEAEIYENTMFNIEGFSPLQTSPILHFAKSLDVLLWGIKEV
jgi:uncharacterized protein